MRRILLLGCLVLLATIAVRTAVAQEQSSARRTVEPATTAAQRDVVKASTKKVLRPLVLPNIEALTTRLLRAERPSVQKQLVKSRQVVGFFEARQHRWLVAPRRTKCWEVPWQRTCTVARHAYRLHSALLAAGQRKLDSELPLPNDWVTSVKIIQRVFPGTESWLLSCSAAEGGHGRWVRYGGGSYYPGYEYTDAVGGWPQYRWSTFKGHYRNGLDALRARGFKVDMPHPSDVRAWLMPMGHAIAAGWARWSGNDDSHWSASWGNGC